MPMRRSGGSHRRGGTAKLYRINHTRKVTRKGPDKRGLQRRRQLENKYKNARRQGQGVGQCVLDICSVVLMYKSQMRLAHKSCLEKNLCCSSQFFCIWLISTQQTRAFFFFSEKSKTFGGENFVFKMIIVCLSSAQRMMWKNSGIALL